jgi:hypothetical protein
MARVGSEIILAVLDNYQGANHIPAQYVHQFETPRFFEGATWRLGERERGSGRAASDLIANERRSCKRISSSRSYGLGVSSAESNKVPSGLSSAQQAAAAM